MRSTLPRARDPDHWGAGGYFPLDAGTFVAGGFRGRLERRRLRRTAAWTAAASVPVVAVGALLFFGQLGGGERLGSRVTGLGVALFATGVAILATARDHELVVLPSGIWLRQGTVQRRVDWRQVSGVPRKGQAEGLWGSRRYHLVGVRVGATTVPLARADSAETMDRFEQILVGHVRAATPKTAPRPLPAPSPGRKPPAKRRSS